MLSRPAANTGEAVFGLPAAGILGAAADDGKAIFRYTVVAVSARAVPNAAEWHPARSMVVMAAIQGRPLPFFGSPSAPDRLACDTAVTTRPAVDRMDNGK